MTYIILEIQKNFNGTVGTLVTAYTDRNTAEQKYHQVLAAAAVSALACHAAVMLTEMGTLVKSEYYTHQEAEPEE